MPKILLSAIVLAALLFAPATVAAQSPPDAVEVQLLGLNDFHGHLESELSGTIADTPTAPRVLAGGAAFLAAHVRALRAENPNSLFVSAGDLIGGSPLVSSLFHDEPTIEAMNEMGLDLNAVGNHEFDEGAAELRRMQEGGCHPTDGCYDSDGDGAADGFAGARFRFLAANVVDSSTGRPFFRPYAIKRFGGVKIGFIGMTLEGTPDIVSRAGIAGLRFLDEAQTANRYARELRYGHGVKAVVVLLHEGGVPAQPSGIDECNGGLTGPIVDIVERTTPRVDLFITGHTHQAYNCVIDGRPVTSASSQGRLITDIDLTLSRRTRDITAVAVNNRIVTQDVAPAPDLAALVSHYKSLSQPLADRVIGELTGPIERAAAGEHESSAGNLIADAQLAAADDELGAVAAFMNPGGIRANIDAGPVTYGESFAMQPFGNNLIAMDLTGAQLRLLLRQQWCGQTSARILSVAGVSYTFSRAAAAAITGADVDCATAADPITNLTVAGAPVVDTQSYRIVVNSFLADGGDRFFVLREGTNRAPSIVDTDALEAYFAAAGGPIDPPEVSRITAVP